MFNILIGPSGSGKSYEAVVFHVLAQLRRGRKVITNLPLVLEEFAKLDPEFSSLLELRTKPQMIRGTFDPTREAGAYNVAPREAWMPPEPDARVFAGVWDYFDEWRHPQEGFGAFFAVDEAQFAIPYGRTRVEVEEWNALHRHFNQDGLYITQSIGKLSKNIRENVQIVYRCRKNIALGSPTTYTRKVQDGARGEVLNTSIRKYHADNFKLYRSHTQGVGASELNADDVRPLWRHWSFLGAGCCAVVVVAAVASGKVHLPWTTQTKAKPVASKQQAKVAQAEAARPALASASAPAVASSSPQDELPDPYREKGLHLVGVIEAPGRQVYAVAVSQNGQVQMTLTSSDLVRVGYTFKPASDCAAWLTWHGKTRALTCDTPQVGPVVPSIKAAAGA